MAHCTHPEGPAYCKSQSCPGRIEFLSLSKKTNLNIDLPEENTSSDSGSFNEVFDEDYRPIVPEQILDLAYETMDYTDEIEIPNHFNDSEEEYITLTDMLKNPKLFSNNCGPTTWAVIENMRGSVPDGYKVEDYTLEYKQGVHVAVLVTEDSGEQYVIDYTARQYNDRLPCPLVEPRERWENMIDHYVETLYNDSRVKYE